jgi:glycosyltransferase involved in cell wall biosynthesis
MKITFVFPLANYSGGAKVVAVYADKLRERGHDVRIVTHNRGIVGRSIRRRFQRWYQSVFVKKPSLNHFQVRGFDYSEATPYAPLSDADIPDGDIIIATWWETAFGVNVLSPLKGKRIYFVQHHEVHKHLPYDLSSGSYFLPIHKIAISQWLVEAMRTEYGDEDVDLVPNGVDTEQFSALPRSKNKVPTIGLIYSNSSFKGLPIAADAIAKVHKVFPDLKVVAFGREPAQNIKLKFPNLEYHYLPPQGDIKDIYAKCDVYLCSSHSEGFALPILEAMACRCPVVSTKVGVAPEAIEHGANGYLVEPGDSDGLADGLLQVLQATPEKWQQMSDNAFAVAQDNNWDAAADKFEAALLRRLNS